MLFDDNKIKMPGKKQKENPVGWNGEGVEFGGEVTLVRLVNSDIKFKSINMKLESMKLKSASKQTVMHMYRRIFLYVSYKIKHSNIFSCI